MGKRSWDHRKLLSTSLNCNLSRASKYHIKFVVQGLRVPPKFIKNGVVAFSSKAILNHWISTLKAWVISCLGYEFSFKSILTGCDE